jgi:hypothetical protein
LRALAIPSREGAFPEGDGTFPERGRYLPQEGPSAVRVRNPLVEEGSGPFDDVRSSGLQEVGERRGGSYQPLHYVKRLDQPFVKERQGPDRVAAVAGLDREGRPVIGRIRVSTSPGTKVSPRPTGAFSRESMENTLNGKSKERWRWFDHPPVQPLLWPSQSLVPTMLVSRRLSHEGQPGSIKGSALGE